MAVHTSPGTMVMLVRMAKAVHRNSTEDLLGMKLRHQGLLGYLRDRGPVQQQQLCEWLWLDANNCVLLLNELEDLGYVERRRDSDDRRRHVVGITDAGIEALARANEAQEGLEDKVLANLSQKDRETLRRLLAKALATEG